MNKKILIEKADNYTVIVHHKNNNFSNDIKNSLCLKKTISIGNDFKNGKILSPNR